MGGKKATTTSSVSIPPEVLARYNAVNTRAETAAATPYEAFGKTASDYVAPLNARQNAGFNDINATAGSYLPYMTEATTATRAGLGPAYEGINNYMSPYIKNVADTTGAYLRQQQEQAQSGALGNAISSGAFGGDRAGIAAANLQQQNQMAYGKTMADILNQGYTQALGASQADLARQLAGGEQLAGLGAQSQQLGLQGAQAKIAAGTMEQQTEQAGKDAMINQFMQEKGYPFQVAQFLANIATGTGAAAGSTTTTQTPRNWLGFASGGAVEGYADGGGVAGPRTYTQSGIGGAGYVPAADLPVGQLMIADPPEQSQGKGTEEIIKMITMAMGAARGGAIDQRHGYDLGGTPSKWDMMLNDRPGVDSEFKALGRRALTTVLGATPLGPNFGRMLPNLSTVSTFQPATTGVVPSNPVHEDYKNLWTAEDQAKRDAMIAAQRATMRSEAPAAATETIATPAATGVVAPATPATPPAATGVVTPATETPAVTPAGGVGSADVAADAMKTLKVTDVAPNAFDVSSAPKVTLGSETKPAAVDPIDFFNTKIIRQESGDNQFDSKGNPLTSSAGAVGVAQVMEGTGPEAAKLAGLEWDRNRWLNDKEYNKALGQAYFLEQYRQFGSLDKAAAAYNAGPGALASAMDRALALGGSYLDYLPAETQNYVYSTTGMGSPVDTGGLGGGGGDGLGGADMAQQRDGLFTNDKPYEQRNAIGKFFYDPNTGKLDKNALLSVLMGVGKAAEAQTISPLGGILSGIGGGAEAYKGLVKQQADVAQTNIENMRNIQMDTMTYNEMNGTNLTPQQYASMIGASYQIPTGIGQPIGGDKMTWNEYQNGVVQVGGRSVKMQDDPVSIQKFISDNSMFPAESPIGKQVAEARQHLTDINASGGMTVDANGQQFQIPGYTEVGNVQAKTVADQEAAAAFRDAAGDAFNSSAQQLAAVKTLESVYTTMEPGKFANVGAEANAILSALDPGNVTGWEKYDLTDPAQYEIAIKGAGEIMATRLRSMPGGAPAAEIDMLSTVTPTPNMQPEAVKKLLAITKADAQYRLDMYNNYDSAVHGNDVNAYMKQFADSGKTFTRYVEEAMASMPRFAGEAIEPSEAEAELIRRGYKRNSEGKLVKP